jgi:SNF2 family DNA or RNA helicase
MADYWALMWKVRPGTEEAVQELFKNYGRPEHIIRDEEGNEKGRLLKTWVFMKGNTIVRVVEVEGSLADVAVHMGKQPAIRDLEEKLDQYLAEPRDMSTPEGARKFFMESSMQCLVARSHDE